MKKIISFATLFLGIAIFSFAQSNITFKFTSKNGKIITQDKDVFCMSFSISGLNTETDVDAFTKTISSNPIVKHFEIFSKNEGQSERRASLVLLNKEKESFTNLLQSANVKTLNVDNKDYTLDQLDQMGKDLRAKKEETGNKEQSK